MLTLLLASAALLVALRRGPISSFAPSLGFIAKILAGGVGAVFVLVVVAAWPAEVAGAWLVVGLVAALISRWREGAAPRADARERLARARRQPRKRALPPTTPAPKAPHARHRGRSR